MNKTIAIALGLFTLALSSAACAVDDVTIDDDDETEEAAESTSDELKSSCLKKIKAPFGSAAWNAGLKKCIEEDKPKAGSGGGASRVCSKSVSCINGACTCGSGANKGKACVRGSGGANDCDTLCRECK